MLPRVDGQRPGELAGLAVVADDVDFAEVAVGSVG